jgi:hypothetical protein
MTTTGFSQIFREPSGSGGGFNGAKVTGLNQGGSGTFVRIESGADFILGTTGAWPAMSTVYDSAGYWVAANKRFEIPDDGLFMLFHSSHIRFDAGYSGVAGDADGFALLFSSNNTAALVQPSWTPNVVGVNGVYGSFMEVVPLVAGDWVNLTFDNNTTHAMIWPSVEFGIHLLGT